MRADGVVGVIDVLDAMLDAVAARGSAGDASVRDALAANGITGSDQLQIMDRVRRHRDESTRLRRRESELVALFSSARELAEVRDIDELLARLVNRAHEMMGTDVTYLSEFDAATRDLHVRKTVGSVTPEFRRLRVPAGMGLASRITESRAAEWVPVYSEYMEGRHEHSIDDAVFAEGIVSILGVPMLSEGRVLGVLFAATRQEHRFSPEEIALLSALADHASVVLQTANTLTQLRSSEDDARRALERLTRHLEVRDRSNVVHHELVQAVLLGGGLANVAATLSSALERTVTIVDADNFPVASSSSIDSEPGVLTLPQRVQAAIETSRSTGHCYHLVAGSDIQVVSAITAGELFFGAVLLGSGELELGPVDDRTIERATQVAALLALQQNAVADADRRARDELIGDLLDPAPERRRDVERRARSHDVVLTDLNTVLVIVVTAEHRAAAEQSTTAFFHDRGLVGEHAGVITAVVRSADALASAADLRSHIRRSTTTEVLVVVTPPARSVEEFSARFSTGRRTASLLDALGVVDDAVTTQAYAPYLAMFGSDPDALHEFIEHTIGAVIEYDRTHRTDLVATLRAFVRNDASPTKAARALNYHTNTILQRLERIQTLLGDGWRLDEHLFRVSTAVRLDELRAVRSV